MLLVKKLVEIQQGMRSGGFHS